MRNEKLEPDSAVRFELGQIDQPLSLSLSKNDEDEPINYQDPYIQALLKRSRDD